MTNQELTNKIMDMVKSLATIEANTSCIPKMKEDFQVICIEVHDNTQHRQLMKTKLPEIEDNTKFRKNSLKVIWISICAAITGVSGLIFSLIGLKK